MIEEAITAKHLLNDRAEVHDVQYDDYSEIIAVTFYVDDGDADKVNGKGWNQLVVEDFIEDILD